MGLRVELDPIQTRALRLIEPGFTVTLPWGRGAGKTFFDRTLVHKFALEAPGQQIGILYPTLKQARQVIWPLLFDDYATSLKHYVRSRDKTLLEVVYKNGSRVTTWGAENAHAIRGQRFHKLLQDEADEISPDVEHAVVEPTFSKAGMSFVWVKTGTPRRGRQGGLYRDFRRGREGEPGFRSMLVRSDQSPQVDQEWLTRVKSKTPPSIYRREYECDFDSAEGLVFGDVFDPSFHIRQPPDPATTTWTDILIGCDHGWEDAGCLLLIGILGHGKDREAWVLDEIYERYRVEDWWKTQLRRWTFSYPRHKFYGDPSQPSRIEAYRADCKARPQTVDNSIDEGISALADKFMIRSRFDERGAEIGKYARLYITPGCVNLLTELGVESHQAIADGPYRRKRDTMNPERFTDEFVDKNNHGVDPLRYAIFNYFGPAPWSRQTSRNMDTMQQ